MLSYTQPRRFARFAVFFLLFSGVERGSGAHAGTCPPPCVCFGELVDCGRVKRGRIPDTIPEWTVQLDLSHNKLQVLDRNLFSKLLHLKEVKLNHNKLEAIPDLGSYASNITTLILANNRITGISEEQLGPLASLETLDLGHNKIVGIKFSSFPALPLKNLFLSNNRISSLELGWSTNLASTLQVLDLSHNRISNIPARSFQLPNLQHLDLSRNHIRRVDGLTFQDLPTLRSLHLQRNRLSGLMDGAFFGLSNMEVLQLGFNNLTEVSKGWLYGLGALEQLHLEHNTISRIKPETWKCCQKLSKLNLSSNHLSRLEESSFDGLSLLEELHIGNNRVSFIAGGAFRGLSNLQMLDLQNNEISWTIEDMNGPFSALEKMKTLLLQGNQIRSVTKKSFSGLDELQHLDLSNNGIMSIQVNAFSQMKNLRELRLNTSSLLCDCQLKWLPVWVAEQTFLPSVNASCAHPQMLKGRSVFSVRQEEFVCDDFPKPKITVQPETQSALKGTNVTFICSAASSSDSPMTFAWKKDNEVVNDAEIQNQAHLRVQEDVGSDTEVTEYTTTLQLRNVEFSDEGKYQCVISNHFGSSYSTKARLTVNILPSFTKTPMDLTTRVGAMARLECAATGHPSPQIAWQKDGGIDFPAARERRMHVMPEDDIFFIVDVKTEDVGVYSCTAQNTAGAISANATLTVLETPHFLRRLINRTVVKGETAVLQCIAGGSPPPRLNWTKDDSPLVVTERHFFAATNQLLIIVDAAEADAGKYTCEMSNPLGTERGNIYLAVLPNPNCDSGGPSGAVNIMGSWSGADDVWTLVGIVIIAVVCCIVGTSLVWVVIIYHTRWRNEDCSVTNTDETNLPADIPSYLSSQGTLADRQDAYIPSETGSNHQYIAPSYSGFYLQPKDMNGLCQLDTGSEADIEATIDPLLCNYQGPIDSLLYRANLHSNDHSEIFTGFSIDQKPVSMDSCSGSLTKTKKIDFIRSDHYDLCSPSLMMQLTNQGPGSQHRDRQNTMDEKDALDCGKPHNCVSPCNTFMGTFGKAPWDKDLYIPPSVTHHGMTRHENPYTPLDVDSDHEQNAVKDSMEQGNCVYEQPFDLCRTDALSQRRMSS